MLGLKKLLTRKINTRLQKSQQLRKPNDSGILAPMSDDSLIGALGKIDQHALWASCLWGAIASGYWIYGWKQKEMVPCLGGFAMTAVCFISSVLWMSLASIIIMVAVWWLSRRGY
jgi:hypothetical protein